MATAVLQLGPESRPAAAVAERGPAPRFVFIDALRGIAALGVVACHVAPKSPTFAPWFHAVLEQGWLGVQVFLVISGFVIAHSVRNARLDGRYLANFALRRSIRLDPPYWATLVAIVVVAVTMQRYLGEPAALPSVGQFLAHLCYLQTALGYQDLNVVFWTLRLEILFYLGFIVLLALAQRGSAKSTAGGPNVVGRVGFLAIALVSLAAFSLGRLPGVVQYFHMFLLGAFCLWSLNGKATRWPLVLLLLAMAAATIAFRNEQLLVAMLTGSAVYLVGRAGRLQTWLNWPVLQYLGRISYSLYLIHAPVLDLVQTAGRRWSGETPHAVALWMVVAIAASLAAAHLLHIWVERPSMRLAARLRRDGVRKIL